MQSSTPRGTRSTVPMSHQEALRTLALGMDIKRPARAEITVDADGIAIDAGTTYGYRKFTWHEIDVLSRTQQGHRRARPRAAPWMDPAALTRWAVLLRLVGQLLDEQGIGHCTIRAAVATTDAPDMCHVEVTANRQVVLDSEAVHEHLAHLRARYIEPRANAPAGPSRPWWAFWRKE